MRSRSRSGAVDRRRADGARSRRGTAKKTPRRTAGWYRRLYETPKIGRLYRIDEA